MSLSRPLRARYWKINQIVDRLLEERSITEPYVPIERVAKNFGIEIRAGDLDEVSGVLMRNSNVLMIGVNSKQSVQRQRFTVAHELGHYILHEGISSHLDLDFRVNFRSPESSQATDVEEIEANYFAASILMPKSFLDMDNAVEALDSDSKVESLAKRYKVSRHAMSLRLVNLYEKYRPF